MKTRVLCLGVLACGVLLAVGCKRENVSEAGMGVTLVAEQPSGCENLGMVVGRGGGTFGGKWISNEKLIEYANNDARNKAAKKGATHIVLQTPQLGVGGAAGHQRTSTATVTGIGFKCPPEASAPAAPAAAE